MAIHVYRKIAANCPQIQKNNTIWGRKWRPLSYLGPCYGNYFNYDDACSADLGDGWYMPNEEQMTALLQQFRVWDIGGSRGQVGLQYPVGNQTLYMPYCGKIVNDADQLCGKEGFYWIKQANNSESKYIWLHDGGFSVESGDRSDRMTIRPIHDLHEI